jgi:hypothetical protein
LVNITKALWLRRRKPGGFKIKPAQGVHPQAAHAALALDHQPVVDQRYDRLLGQQLLAPRCKIHFARAPQGGILLPVTVDAVLDQRDFIQMREKGKSSGRVKLALLSQISLAISPDAIRHSPLP